jgi:surfeit locus 1 family protein
VSTGSRLRFWVITLAALAVVGLTTALGAWQLGRAHQRLARQQALLHQQQRAPVGEQALYASTSATQLLQRAIVVRGTWLPRYTIFLDNRQMDGKVGFFVVTPLRLQGTGRPVLVERGWVQRNFEHREALPPIPTSGGIVTVRGRIAPPPAKLYDFGGAPAGAIRQNIDLSAFRAETGLPLLALAIRQTDGDADDGLLRHWPEPASGAETNYGYAFQWWALAALTAILYVWFQLIAPRRKASHA